MFEFKILKKSKKSLARIGLIKTKHGEVITPCLVPVATQAVVKTLESREVEETKTQILICNTFHLHLKPGEKIIKEAGGLHKFMNWKKPLMTDSGGYQVFSLGFGFDFKIGKVLKTFPEEKSEKIRVGDSPRFFENYKRWCLFQIPFRWKRIIFGTKRVNGNSKKFGRRYYFFL